MELNELIAENPQIENGIGAVHLDASDYTKVETGKGDVYVGTQGPGNGELDALSVVFEGDDGVPHIANFENWGGGQFSIDALNLAGGELVGQKMGVNNQDYSSSPVTAENFNSLAKDASLAAMNVLPALEKQGMDVGGIQSLAENTFDNATGVVTKCGPAGQEASNEATVTVSAPATLGCN